MVDQVEIIEAPDDRYLPGYKQGTKSIGPRLIETRVVFSLYGTPIPVSYGLRVLQGNVIWSLPLNEIPLIENDNTTYTYYGTFAVSFGYPGDVDIASRQLLRVWADGRLILDNRSNGRAVARSFRYRWYDGSETQLPDPTIEADKGPGFVPAFRGQMYLVITDLPLRFFDNKVPFIQVEVGDVDATENLVTPITASGESNNSGNAMVNWSTGRAFLHNTGLTPDGMFLYDFDDELFLGGRSANIIGVSQDGEIQTGVNSDKVLYIPWLNAFIGTPENAIEALNTLLLIDADTGDNIATLIDTVTQTRLFRAGLIPANTPVTVIVSISSTNDVEFCGWDGSEFKRGGDLALNTPFGGTGTVAFFGESSVTGIAFYCVDETQPDVLSRAFVTPLVAMGTTEPSIDLEWLPYGGAEMTPPDIVSGLYCPQFDAVLVIYDNGEACLTDIDTKTDLWRITGLPEVPSIVEGTECLQMGDQTGGLVVYCVDNTVVEIDLSAGTFRTFALASNVLASNSATFDSASKMLIGRGTIDGKLKKVKYEYADVPTITIGELITQIALRMGYAEADIDIDAGVDAEIYGAVFTEAISLAELGEIIKTLYGYEIRESGGKIMVTNTLNNYTTPAFTIDQDDLIDGDAPFLEHRIPDRPIPRTFALKYIDPELGYEWATQLWGRDKDTTLHDSEDRNEVTVPFIMSATMAKNAAFRAVYRGFETRASYAFSLPESFNELEPGDIIEATINGTGYLIRPITVDYNTDFTLTINGEEFQAYEDIELNAFGGVPYEAEVKRDTRPFMVTMGLPYLNIDDIPQPDRSIYYYVVSPGEATAENFSGTYGNIGIQFAGTVSWRRLELSTFSVPVGRLLRTFGAADEGMEHAIDTKNTINMYIDSGDADLLASATYEEMMAGANIAAVGAPGRWEIIRWQDIGLEADGSYTISNILRGCYNTERFANTLGLLMWMRRFDYLPAPEASIPVTADVSQAYVSENTLSRGQDYFIPLESEWLYKDTLSVADFNFDYRTTAGAQTDGKQGDKVVPVQGLFESEIPPAATDFNVERDSDGFLTFKFNVVPRYSNPWFSGGVNDVDPTRNETNKFCLYVWVPYNDESAYELTTVTKTVIVQAAVPETTTTEKHWIDNISSKDYGKSMSAQDIHESLETYAAVNGYPGSGSLAQFWRHRVHIEEVSITTPAIPEISYVDVKTHLPLIYAYTFEVTNPEATQSITLPWHTPAPGLDPDGDAALKWDVPVGALSGVPSGAQRDLAFPFVYCGVRRLVNNQGAFAPNVRALAAQSFAIKYTGSAGTFGPTNYTKVEANKPAELHNAGTNGIIYPDPALNEDNGFRAGNIKWTKAIVKDV